MYGPAAVSIRLIQPCREVSGGVNGLSVGLVPTLIAAAQASWSLAACWRLPTASSSSLSSGHSRPS